MKLYEAIEIIVNDFGKEIISNDRVMNMFSDYNAFEESKTFKIILKNLINEGYMEQLLYVRDWSNSQDRIINNFISATSFNEANASYVIKSLAYALGYIKTAPIYQPSAGPSQPSSPSNSNSSQSKSQSPSPANKPSGHTVSLDKTSSQYDRLSEDSKRKYKEAAEKYLEGIVEFKSDFEKDLGVKISSYVQFDQFANIIPIFELDGKIKLDYDFSLMFYVLLYDQNDRMMVKKDIYVGQKRGSYEVVQTLFDPSEYHIVNNIKRILVYWEKA